MSMLGVVFAAVVLAHPSSGQYSFNRTPSTYEEARRYCARSGWHLLCIHDSAEQHSSHDLSKEELRAGRRYWIGYTSAGGAAPWKWADEISKPVVSNYSNWAQGFPSPSTLPQCTVADVRSGFWENRDCTTTSRFGFACHNITVSSNGYLFSPVVNDWHNYIGTRLPYQAAKQQCRNQNGLLVSIHSEEESEIVFEEARRRGITEDFYIGLSDFQCDGIWQWDDWRSASGFTNWKQGHPTLECGKRCAVVSITSGKWFNTDCAGQHPFVCDRGPYVGPTFSAGDGWIYSDITNAYYKAEENNLDGEAAEANCVREGQLKGVSSHLVSIHSHAEGHLVKALLDNALAAPFSNCSRYHAGQMWIGLRLTKPGRIAFWTDGTNVTFRNWRYGEPNNVYDIEYCTQMYVDCQLCCTPQEKPRYIYYWNDYACNETSRFAICKIPL